MSRAHFAVRWSPVLVLVLTAMAPACAPVPDASEAPSDVIRTIPVPLTDSGARCGLAEEGRFLFTSLGGGELYVEPWALFGSVRPPVLLGQPLYEWHDAPLGQTRLAARNHAMGAWLDEPARLIPLHPGVPEASWGRAAPLPRGRAGMLLERPEADRREARRIGFATLQLQPSADPWGPWEPLPEPPDGALDLALGSPLMTSPVTGDLYWAALAFRRPGIDVVLYRRAPEGSWTSIVVSRDWADDAGLALRMTGATPLVLVAGLDPALGEDVASVRVVDPERPGAPSIRLDSGAPGDRFRQPSAIGSADGHRVFWLRERPGEGVTLRSADLRGSQTAMGRPLAARTVAVGVSFFAIVEAAGTPFAVVQRRGTVTGIDLIEVYFAGQPDIPLAYASANPFSGPMTVSTSDDDALLVIGPQVDRSVLAPSVRSLLLRFVLSCTHGIAAHPRPGHTPQLTRRHHATSHDTAAPVRRPDGRSM